MYPGSPCDFASLFRSVPIHVFPLDKFFDETKDVTANAVKQVIENDSTIEQIKFYVFLSHATNTLECPNPNCREKHDPGIKNLTKTKLFKNQDQSPLKIKDLTDMVSSYVTEQIQEQLKVDAITLARPPFAKYRMQQTGTSVFGAFKICIFFKNKAGQFHCSSFGTSQKTKGNNELDIEKTDRDYKGNLDQTQAKEEFAKALARIKLENTSPQLDTDNNFTDQW